MCGCECVAVAVRGAPPAVSTAREAALITPDSGGSYSEGAKGPPLGPNVVSAAFTSDAAAAAAFGREFVLQASDPTRSILCAKSCRSSSLFSFFIFFSLT